MAFSPRVTAKLIGLITLLATLCAGCGSGGTPVVAVPAVSPIPGAYSAPLSIELSVGTRGANIYYTTDGALPSTSSTRYTGPIQVTSTVSIKAVGIARGYEASPLLSVTYTLPAVRTLPPAAAPVFSLPSGTYNTAQTITLSDTTPGASIYYTVDGSTPTAASALYGSPIVVDASQTIHAIALASGYSQSAIASASYNITAAVTSLGQWTWVSGSDTDLSLGVYGTEGVPSASNSPGAREATGTWVDNNGDLWLFGGGGYGASGNSNEVNDLWHFNLASGQWTWVTGSTMTGAYGSYGVLGVPSPTNTPGCRIAGPTWVDASGKFWMFGGVGSDSTQANGALNDLWMFDPDTTLWTWEGGNDALGMSGKYGVQGVPSTANLPGARDAEATWTDKSGNFWLFGGAGLDAYGTYRYLNDLWRFNPRTKEWTWVSGNQAADAPSVYGTQGVAAATNVPGARAYSTGWADSAGNFWVFGGSKTNAGFDLMNDLWMFNTSTNQWTWVSGSSTIDANGTYGTKGQATANTTPGSRFGGLGWADGNHNLYFFGGAGYSDQGRFNLGAFNDLWKFDTQTKLWTWIDGSSSPVANPVYGTKGVSAPGNIPGSRVYTTGWTRKAGGFWLLGGTSEVPYGSGLTNDLWRYDP